jgi:hypothetical protein
LACFFCEVQNLASSLGISIEKPRATVRSHYRSNATSALTGGDGDNAETYFCINLYILMLDQVLTDLKSRFSQHHADEAPAKKRG